MMMHPHRQVIHLDDRPAPAFGVDEYLAMRETYRGVCEVNEMIDKYLPPKRYMSNAKFRAMMDAASKLDD